MKLREAILSIQLYPHSKFANFSGFSSYLSGMHIITRKRLNDFAEKHSDASSGLIHWYRLMKSQNFNSFGELRAVFPTADKVGHLTVFNVGGHKVRVIAAVHFDRKRIYIRAVLTHEEYDERKWKE